MQKSSIADNKEVAVEAEQLNNNHNVIGDTTIAVNSKYGHITEAHISGGIGSG